MSVLKKIRRAFRKKGKKKSGRKSGKKSGYTPRRSPALESKGGASQHKTQPPRKFPRYRRRSKWFRRLVRKLMLWGGVAVVCTYLWFSWGLPDIDDLNKFTKAPSILIKSEDGQIIGSFGDIYGDFVDFEDLPAALIDAVIATEDRNYYHHFGIDPLGLLRATIANIRARHVVQGGSTITQQVAKNVFLTPERSLSRKIREMMLAVKLERRFTKKEILSIYLNRVYLGAGSYGVDAASKRYFDKPARDMNLSESAIMAGLLKAPSRYAPTGNPTLARKRGEQVLVNMADAGYLTPQQVEKGRRELTATMGKRPRDSQSALYFADWLFDQLADYVGNVQQDLVVITTLRPDWQALAEKSMNDIMEKDGEPHAASQSAIVAMSPDGAIRVMIGGRSYAESQYNRATQALRQPGSSFKLFVYLAGLESGLTPDTMVEDKPITIPISGGNWSPKNYNNRYLGVIPLREAVQESINTVAVQVSERAGRGHVIDIAHRLGINADLDPVPSIALGATEVSLLELTNAYAHLASGGAIVNPYGILQVDTVVGETLYQRRGAKSGVVLRGDVVGMMNEMLMGVVTGGTGRAAQIGRPAAGKTGTTSDYKDAWFIGYTPDLVAGVWVGNDDNTPMKKVTGGMLPARIWHNFMQPALASTPVSSLPTDGSSGFLPWDGPSGGGLELGSGFWDKLLGGAPDMPKKGKVEYQYPTR